MTDPIHEVYNPLRKRIEELEATFDLRWKADMRAIKMWHDAHPGKELVWPDHADLVVWLLEQLPNSNRDELKSYFAYYMEDILEADDNRWWVAEKILQHLETDGYRFGNLEK